MADNKGMTQEALALRLEVKLDALMKQQHDLSERLIRSVSEMRVRLEEYDKRLSRYQHEVVNPLERRVDKLSDKQADLASDMRQISAELSEVSRNISEVAKIVERNSDRVQGIEMTKAKAAGVLAALTAFISFISAIIASAVNTLMGV